MLISENYTDQASGLRRMAKSKPVRVIAVTSGKGGVGKTNISVNLAIGLSAEGKDVLLMDADLGLANVDVLLGIHSNYNLSHVISGDRNLEEVIVRGPNGLKIIPSSSGLQEMADLSSAEHAGLVRAFSEISHNLDVLIIDTAAGISGNVINFSRAAQEIMIVLCDEPTSLTDAYALVKLLNRDYGLSKFHIIANMVKSTLDGKALFNKLVKVTDRYLDVALDFAGSVPNDEYVRKAVQKQRAVIDLYPRSKAAVAFKKLAQKTDNWPMPVQATGNLEFFVERLILSSQETVGETT